MCKKTLFHQTSSKSENARVKRFDRIEKSLNYFKLHKEICINITLANVDHVQTFPKQYWPHKCHLLSYS